MKTKTREHIGAKQEQIAAVRQRLRTMAASGIGMSCGACGHFDDIARFMETAVFGELPRNQFQCPACGLAVERKQSKPKLHPSGFEEPGEVTLETVNARL